MLNRKICATIFFLLLLTACGPKTIYVRPNLDTPQRHVTNGWALLDQGKIQHALREFQYANELDPQDVAALVGTAVTLGHKGEFDQAFTLLEKAEGICTRAEDKVLVQNGYARIKKLRDNP